MHPRRMPRSDRPARTGRREAWWVSIESRRGGPASSSRAIARKRWRQAGRRSDGKRSFMDTSLIAASLEICAALRRTSTDYLPFPSAVDADGSDVGDDGHGDRGEEGEGHEDGEGHVWLRLGWCCVVDGANSRHPGHPPPPESDGMRKTGGKAPFCPPFWLRRQAIVGVVFRGMCRG